MKKARILALLCVIALVVSILPAASAAKAPITKTRTRGAIEWTENRLIKNGETVTFDLNYGGYALYEVLSGSEEAPYYAWDDLDFDCAGPVTASTSASWIHITKNKRGFSLYIDSNQSIKTRSAKITVTGKKFKATLKFRQYGKSEILSVIRQKDQITVKLNPSSSKTHMFFVEMTKTLSDGTTKYKYIVDDWDFTDNTYTFTVKKGWNYQIVFGASFQYTTGDGGWGAIGYWDDGVEFTVKSIKGKEVIK